MVKRLKEFRLDNADALSVGDVVKADTFDPGDKIDVTGVSQGPRLSGRYPSWNAQRTPTSHGGGPVHRHLGSMRTSTDPSRIFPGHIGAGHMGVDQITVQNLDVVSVDWPEYARRPRRDPRPQGGIVYVKTTVKTQTAKKGAAAAYQRQSPEGFCPCQPEGSARNK